MELAQILSILGCDVNLVIRKSQVLRKFDDIIKENLMESLKHSKVNISNIYMNIYI